MRCPGVLHFGFGLHGAQGSARWLALMLLFLAAAFASPARAFLFADPFANARDPLLIVSYQPVSKTPVAGTRGAKALYDYVYRVQVRNRGVDLEDLSATVSSRRRTVTIQDGTVAFGPVARQATKTGLDTIAVRAPWYFDRRLDRKVRKKGRWVFEPEGSDPEDAGISGLPAGLLDLLDSWLNDYYTHKLSHVFAWSFDPREDATPPGITGQAPKDSTASSPRVTITAQYADAKSGIDVTKVYLSLDGQDVTSATARSATGISYQSAAPLAHGRHAATLKVADAAGNVAESTWQFAVDAEGPVIAGLTPISGSFLSGRTAPTLSARYSDGGADIDAASVQLWLNGQALAVQAGSADIIYTAPTPLAEGGHAAKLVVADRNGNVSEANWQFVVDASAPLVSNVQPTAEGWTKQAMPTISAQYQDRVYGSGLDVATVRVLLDGVDVTAQAVIAQDHFQFTPAQSLAEGTHLVRVELADKVGNAAVQEWRFQVDTKAPRIFAEQPKDKFLPADSQPVITASYTDEGAGIDIGQTRLVFSGIDVTGQAILTPEGFSYATSTPLPDATHVVQLTVMDKAGNTSTQEWKFITTQPPVVGELAPKDVLLPPGSQPTISASYSDSRVGVDVASVRLIINGTDVTAQSQVSASGITYTPPQPLEVGPVTAYLEVSNKTNGFAQAVWGFDVDTPTTYGIALVSPASNSTVTEPRVQVRVRAESNKTYVTGLSVNGQAMRESITENGEVEFIASVALQDGPNSLTITAQFDNGENRSITSVVIYDAPPRVTITAPVDHAILGAANVTSPRDLTGTVERPVTVTGRVSKPVASVTINQQKAALTGGTEFRFDNFFLHEGTNLLSVVATDAQGRTGTSAITVSVDQTAPIVSIEHPLTDSVTSSARIDVRGVVNDAVEGMVGALEPTVMVNGVKAQVADRYYVARDVPLVPGANTVTVVATDHVGNSRSAQLAVSRLMVGSDRLTLLSGNHQKAAPNTELPQPLTVVALNRAGEPLANVPVTFEVHRGTGTITRRQGEITKPDGINPARVLTVTTDSGGHAKVWFTVGRLTGAGANVVRAAVAPDAGVAIAEDVFFVATTERGLPAQLIADMGTNQYAELRTEPLEALTAIVQDSDGNPIPNVPITFRVSEGDASFLAADGSRLQMQTLLSDKNGTVAARPLLGNTAGVVRIVARTVADPANPAAGEIGAATFLVQAKEPKDGPTTFRGFVYTDKGEPMAGVRMSVGRTNLSVTSDEQGGFVLANVPPGRIDLFVDARMSTFQGKQWPALHFEVIAIRGQDNQLPHPIYLPPLAMSEAKWVGGNEDVVLKIPGLNGFQMKVKANSVTFPDGSHEGLLVVSPVVADRLPMSPPGGSSTFGQPAWTIQPSGTRFDPPIEVTMPNVGGMKPGEIAPVVQWDHDLAQYVPMGRATVTEDGAFLVTDPGTGISKAGWGGCTGSCPLPPPQDPPRCSVQCAACQMAGSSEGASCPACVADPSRNRSRCDDNDSCTTEDKCNNGVCKGTEIKAKIEYAPPTICLTRTKQVVAKTTPEGRQLRWAASGNLLVDGAGSITGRAVGAATVRVTDLDCSRATDVRSIRVMDDASSADGDGTVDFCTSSPAAAEACARGAMLRRRIDPSSLDIGSPDETWVSTNFKSNYLLKVRQEDGTDRFVPVCRALREGRQMDAATHAYLACSLYRALGNNSELARGVLNAHEADHPEDPCESHDMDYENNETGRELAREEGSCTDVVMNALNSGRLHTNNGNYPSEAQMRALEGIGWAKPVSPNVYPQQSCVWRGNGL